MSRPCQTRAAAWLCAALVLAPVAARTTAAPQVSSGLPAPAQAMPSRAIPAQAPPVLRATTRLVQVNVIVRGKNGEPVLGLTEADFGITDAGVAQQVATLTVESMRSAAPAPGAKPQPELPPNVFSNMAAFKPATPKAVTVILMDGLNTAFGDQVHARQQLAAFLYTLTPNDRVALYTLGREVHVLHDFTDDHLLLLKALDRHRARTGSELTDSNPVAANTGDPELDALFDATNRTLADFRNTDRVQTTLSALEAIAQHVAAIPGRKNLVWISGGFPLSIGMEEMNIGSSADRRSFSDDVEHATRAITAAQLAIYPVDARGLATLGYDASALTSTPKEVLRPRGGPSRALQDLQLTHETMRMIAQRTGGKASYNSNDLKGAIRGAMDDAEVTYVVGYYPTHNTWDGTFHEIKVKVNRPGVRVRHRGGYFAFAEQAPTEQTRRTALAEAARSPLDATSVDLSVRLAPDVPQKGGLRVLMVIEPRQITFEQKDGRWTGLVDVIFVHQAAPDKAATATREILALNYTRERYQKILERGVMLARDFDYATTAYSLRVVVRDAASGKLGSVTIRTDRLEPLLPPKG
jgi:VWFA-related protein